MRSTLDPCAPLIQLELVRGGQSEDLGGVRGVQEKEREEQLDVLPGADIDLVVFALPGALARFGRLRSILPSSSACMNAFASGQMVLT